MADQLARDVQFLESGAREAGVPVVRAYLADESSLDEVCLDSDEPERACREFVSLAATLRPAFVAISTQTLSQEDLQGAIEEHPGDDADEAPQELEDLRSSVGHVEYVKALFLCPAPPSVVSLELFAPWHGLVYGDELDDDAVETEEVERLTPEEVTAHASALAADPAFQKAANREAKLLIARRTLGQAVAGAEWQLDKIIREAQSIYDVDIKARKDDAAREKAKALLAQGWRRTQVAAELGLTPHKLGKLLD